MNVILIQIFETLQIFSPPVFLISVSCKFVADVELSASSSRTYAEDGTSQRMQQGVKTSRI
jgi:hypothetical protein